jgi:hypothetical protein
MKKEYVVVRIDAPPEGAPYVIVSLSSVKDIKENNTDGPLTSPFGKANVMGFTNMNDMAKELNQMMAGGGGGGFGMQGNQTSIKLDMIEYKNLGISVGDKVFLDIVKAESSGV